MKWEQWVSTKFSWLESGPIRSLMYYEMQREDIHKYILSSTFPSGYLSTIFKKKKNSKWVLDSCTALILQYSVTWEHRNFSLLLPHLSKWCREVP